MSSSFSRSASRSLTTIGYSLPCWRKNAAWVPPTLVLFTQDAVKLVAVAERTPAHVTGNGRDTIGALVEAANAEAAAHYGDEVVREHYLSLKLHGLIEAPEHLAVFCDMAPDAGAR